MHSKFYIVTQIKNKKLNITPQQSQVISGNLSFYSEDEEVIIEISPYNKKKFEENKRTEQQNKYYHKLLDIICDYTGQEHLELHNNLKCMFLSRPWINEEKEYLIVKSTRDLTGKEFGNYLERVFNWSSEELGVILPSSSDYYDK